MLCSVKVNDVFSDNAAKGQHVKGEKERAQAATLSNPERHILLAGGVLTNADKKFPFSDVRLKPV